MKALSLLGVVALLLCGNAQACLLQESENNNNESGADFDWFLYRSSGSYIASGQSSANPETGSYTASPAGAHFIKVTRYSGTGNYQLMVNFS